MAPTVVLHLISAGERCFAKSFAEKWQEYGYVPLRVLGMEAAAEVEEQIRARFWKCKSTQTGLMSTAIRLRDMDDPVKKSLSTILEAARADDSDLLELNTTERSLPVYVDFKRKSESDGEARASIKAPEIASDDEEAMATAVCKGNSGSRGTKPRQGISAHGRSVSKQVMAQWFPRDTAGAFHRRTIEGVPKAWFEGMVSLVQLTMQEQGMPVDSRPVIRHCMSREVAYWQGLIHRPVGGRYKLKAPALEQLARDGKRWKEDNDATLAAGRIPERLASANKEAMQKGFIQAKGTRRDMQALLTSSASAQTPAKGTRTRNRYLQAPKKPVGKDRTIQGSKRVKPEGALFHSSSQVTARCRENDKEDAGARAKAGQSTKAARKRTDSASVGLLRQPSLTQEYLASKFGHKEATKVAGQGHVLAIEPSGGHEGGQSEKQLTSETMFIDPIIKDEDLDAAYHATHEQDLQLLPAVTEEAARAALTKRKRVAVSDQQLTRLRRRRGSSDEESEATDLFRATLFWAGEELELTDVGGGRFYPCRYVREEGDESLEDWTQKEAQGTMPEGEYEVVAIVDERRCPHGGMSEFIVKWKGYELNAEQWLPYDMLAFTKAMYAWTQKLAADGQWHASCHAE